MRHLVYDLDPVTGEPILAEEFDDGQPVPEGPLTPEQARALMQHVMDDCPLCQEERARTGKAPDPGELIHFAPRAKKAQDIEDRPPNWWHGRRRKRGRH